MWGENDVLHVGSRTGTHRIISSDPLSVFTSISRCNVRQVLAERTPILPVSFPPGVDS
jgi:hypothetical protein